jgi:hypothetical protein
MLSHVVTLELQADGAVVELEAKDFWRATPSCGPERSETTCIPERLLCQCMFGHQLCKLHLPSNIRVIQFLFLTSRLFDCRQPLSRSNQRFACYC